MLNSHPDKIHCISLKKRKEDTELNENEVIYINALSRLLPEITNYLCIVF